MNHPDEPLDPREEALVRALHAEAETVRPAGDGLVQIRARVERRRSRTRWVLPSASAAAVAATVTALVASGGFTTGKRSAQLGIGVASLTAASTPTAAVTSKAKRTTFAVATPSPAPTTAAVRTEAPLTLASPVAPSTPTVTTRTTVAADNSTLLGPTPVWPFANAAAAANWQKSATSSKDWHLSAIDTATHFVNALKLTGVVLGGHSREVSLGLTAEVSLERTTADSAAPIPFASVELSHWAGGPKAPWGVVAVTSSSLNISAPEAGADVSGSFQVAYSAPGTTEGQVEAAVYRAGAPTSALVRSAVTSPGTVTLPPSAPAGPAYVVLTATSGGGSTPSAGSLAVVPVQLTAGTPPSTTYAALVNGTIEVLDAASGTVLRTLAGGATGIASVAVTEDRQWVYYATAQGVMRTPYDGSGTPSVMATEPARLVAVAGKDGEQLSYLSASPDGQDEHVTWKSATGTGAIQISQSLPPEAETLAINPTGTQIASYIRGGMAGGVGLFTVPAATDITQGTAPAECTGATPCAGATYAPDGDLLYATSDGTTVTVYRQHAGQDQALFHVTASSQVVNLDVDPSGSEVLLTQGGGAGWMWDGTKTTALPTGVTDASW